MGIPGEESAVSEDVMSSGADRISVGDRAGVKPGNNGGDDDRHEGRDGGDPDEREPELRLPD